MKKKITIILAWLLALAFIVTAGVVGYYHVQKRSDDKRREKELRQYYELYDQMLLEFEEENQTYADFEVDVVFLGDSLTQGYDVQRYYPEYVTVNRGIGGDTTYRLKERLEVSVLDLQPKICVMQIGGNNVDTMFEDYEDILLSFKERMPATKIVLVSHAPTSGDFGHLNKTMTHNNVKIRLYAEKYGCEFVDIYTPLFDIETGEIKAEYTVDGAHFTEVGYDVVTQRIKSVVDRLLAE